MTTGFGEINVVCTDLEASLAFYRDALVLPELEREDGAVRLGLGPITVLLLPHADRSADLAPYPDVATISFDVVVDDLDTTLTALDAAGGERLGSFDDGAGWAVADPDGNVLEIVSAAAAAHRDQQMAASTVAEPPEAGR